MAVYDKNVLDRVGKYNLSTLEIISYKQNKEESLPKTMDIKGIALTMSMTEDIFSNSIVGYVMVFDTQDVRTLLPCLLYTSPSPRDSALSRMPSSA